jgi:hypothetical protein
MLKLIGLTIIFVGLVSCASQPISDEEAKDILLINQKFSKSDGKIPIVVKRDQGFGGSGCSSQVFIDSFKAVELNSGTKATLYVEGGEHILSAEPMGICGGLLSELKINVSPNSINRYRISISSGGDYVVQPTAR